MNRISNTERLGVNATEAIVIKDLEWIFREQPIQDVGIDALIEEADGGNPMGRFIAVQIKSGEGNFHISDDKLTYYVSSVHYNYWLKLEIPIILVAHLPETDKTYWEEISSRTFKKTTKKWKIEIPFKQLLQANSKKKLLSIMSSPNDDNTTFRLLKGNLEVDTIDDIAEDALLLGESVVSLDKITDTMESVRVSTRKTTTRILLMGKQGVTLSDSRFKACLKSYGKSLGICSRRLESEIALFAELYSSGFWAYEQMILINYAISKNSTEVEECLNSIEKLPSNINSAIEGIRYMRNSALSLPEDDSTLKKAKKHFLSIADLIVDELNDAKEMAMRLIVKIK